MNYHKEMLKQIACLDSLVKPTLLLHTCCAPCSTTAIFSLIDYFKVTVFYYNPNIEPKEEYLKRKEEQKRLLKEIEDKGIVNILDCDYDLEKFKEIAKGLEMAEERGARCFKCYKLRLEKTALTAKVQGYDYFASSLTVSPYKNATWINEIGLELALKYNVNYLCSDFKKENGYLKSINYAKQYNLYRQDYCGCIYSKKNKGD